MTMKLRSYLLSTVVLALAAVQAAAQAPAPSPAPAPQRPRPPAAAPQAAAPQAAAPAARPTQAPARSGGDADVVARVGAVDVKADEITALVNGLDERQRSALAKDPALLSQAVRSLLANRLVLKEALGKKWEQKPDVVEQLQRLRETLIVESYLKSLSEPPADFPTEADVKAVYEANKSQLIVPRSFNVSQIFVAGARDGDKAVLEAARKKLAEVQAKLKQPGADFAAVAKRDSDAKETGERGGDIGWITETQVRPELRAILLGLAKGAVAEPVQMDDGWHILKLVDTRASAPRPYEEVREQLVQRVREERANQMRRAYMAELLKKSPPAINELALSKVATQIKANDND